MSTITTPIAPPRSIEQRRLALDRANEIRMRRADLKRELRTGTRSPLHILADPPGYVDSMKVYDLLLSLPKVGRVKALAMLKRNGISPAKTIGGLSPRQREALHRELEGSRRR